jgi:hypothetical protein
MSGLLKTSPTSEEKMDDESQPLSPSVSENDNAFTENCECIENIKFDYPIVYNEYDPEQYLNITSNKTEAYIQEVIRHAHSKGDENKKCHRKLHTTSLVFVKAQKKHRKTLLVMRQASEGLDLSNMKFQFGTKSDISVDDFIKAADQACRYYILTARAFQKAQSKVTFVALLTCLKNHKQSLTYLKKIIDYEKSCKQNIA